MSKIQISRFLTCFNAKFVSKEFHHPWLLATDKLHTLRNKKNTPSINHSHKKSSVLQSSSGRMDSPFFGSTRHCIIIERPDSPFLGSKRQGPGRTRRLASSSFHRTHPVRPAAAVSNLSELLIITKKYLSVLFLKKWSIDEHGGSSERNLPRDFRSRLRS